MSDAILCVIGFTAAVGVGVVWRRLWAQSSRVYELSGAQIALHLRRRK